jgi:putative dehydrogenase
MGSAVGRRMRQMGAHVMTELNGRSSQSAQRVHDAGLEVVNDDDLLVERAEFILSIVPPAVARTVAERFRSPLARAAHKPVFVECNAIAPATVCGIGALLKATGCIFVDAGIIGGPPTHDLTKGPRFYASGPQADRFADLSVYGLDIKVLDAPIGAASGLKLAYAGLTKGFTALCAAMARVAASHNLDVALRAELARSQSDLLMRLQRFLPEMLPKAYRWAAEMEEIADFVGEEALGGSIYRGAARLYEQIAAESKGNPANEWLSILATFAKGSGDKH